jgi:hypothetical protein
VAIRRRGNKPFERSRRILRDNTQARHTVGAISVSILLTPIMLPYAAGTSRKKPDDEREGDSNARQIRYSRRLCCCAALANAAPRAPRALLIDACGQMRDNALRIWSDQTIVTVRQSPDERTIYCFVGGADRNMKETFLSGHRPGATPATRAAKR